MDNATLENPDGLLCPSCAGAGRERGKLRNGTWPIVTCWRCKGARRIEAHPANTAGPRCSTCEGTGLIDAWVNGPGDVTLRRCPDCSTPESAAIPLPTPTERPA